MDIQCLKSWAGITSSSDYIYIENSSRNLILMLTRRGENSTGDCKRVESVVRRNWENVASNKQR